MLNLSRPLNIKKFLCLKVWQIKLKYQTFVCTRHCIYTVRLYADPATWSLFCVVMARIYSHVADKHGVGNAVPYEHATIALHSKRLRIVDH